MREKEFTMFHKSMNMNRKGAAIKFTYKSVCCALGGCQCVVKSCLPMVASS